MPTPEENPEFEAVVMRQLQELRNPFRVHRTGYDDLFEIHWDLTDVVVDRATGLQELAMEVSASLFHRKFLQRGTMEQIDSQEKIESMDEYELSELLGRIYRFEDLVQHTGVATFVLRTEQYGYVRGEFEMLKRDAERYLIQQSLVAYMPQWVVRDLQGYGPKLRKAIVAAKGCLLELREAQDIYYRLQNFAKLMLEDNASWHILSVDESTVLQEASATEFSSTSVDLLNRLIGQHREQFETRRNQLRQQREAEWQRQADEEKERHKAEAVERQLRADAAEATIRQQREALIVELRKLYNPAEGRKLRTKHLDGQAKRILRRAEEGAPAEQLERAITEILRDHRKSNNGWS